MFELCLITCSVPNALVRLFSELGASPVFAPALKNVRQALDVTMLSLHSRWNGDLLSPDVQILARVQLVLHMLHHFAGHFSLTPC